MYILSFSVNKMLLYYYIWFMLQNRANLKQIRIHLLSELRKVYPEGESTSMARMILEHAGYPSSRYLNDPELEPETQTVVQINEIVTEIHTGKPIQYILGYTHFFDLKIKVNNNVLIPRPETEEMVYNIKSAFPDSTAPVMDLCTGSGCIALALKSLYPEASVSGIEFSRSALETARENGRENGLEVNWLEADLLEAHHLQFETSFSLVVSNPPYVLNRERQLMADNVLHFEPESALFVENHDPLIYYRAIASFCRNHLETGGFVWVEINENLGKETAAIFEHPIFTEVTIVKDIHGKERFIKARKQ